MPTFICEKCGCIDNSAGSNNFWIVCGEMNFCSDPIENQLKLCQACFTGIFDDGSCDPDAHKWHNDWEQKHWSLWHPGKTPEQIIKWSRKNPGSLVNAEEYFQHRKERLAKNQPYPGDVLSLPGKESQDATDNSG